MAVDYEMSQFDNKCYRYDGDDGNTGRVLVPDGPRSGVRVERAVLVGLFGCLFLIMLGLGANLYFIISIHKEYRLATPEPISPQTKTDKESQISSSFELTEGNLTKLEVNHLLKMAAVLDELTVSVKQLGVKVGETTTTSENNKQDILLALSRQHDELDTITQKIGSISGTLDIFEKKLDKIDMKVNATRPLEICNSVNEMRELSNTTLGAKTQGLEELLCQKTDELRNTIEHAFNVTSQKVARVQSVMDSVEKRLDDFDVKLTATNVSNVVSLNLLYDTILGSLDQIQTSVMSTRDRLGSNTEAVREMSNRTREMFQQGQTASQLDNITLRIDSVFGQLRNMENNLHGISMSVNTSRDTVSYLNFTIHERTMASLQTIETSVITNRGQSENNTDTLNELSNQTKRLLQMFTTTQQSMFNISDQLVWASQTVLSVETSIHELDRKYDIVLQSQNVLLQNQQTINTSISQFTLQSEIDREQTNEVVSTALNNISSSVKMQSGLFKVALNRSVSQISELVTNSSGRELFEMSELSQTVRSLANGSQCASTDDKLTELEKFNMYAFANISVALQSLSESKRGGNPEVAEDIASKIDTIEELAEFIKASVTLQANKLENATLSSAIIDILEASTIVQEAVISTAREAPTCRSDGCFIKTIPVGLSASSNFVQKGSVRLANAELSTGSIRGRLEVYRSGSWGTVCDDSFSNTDARVVCRMFGYSIGTQKQSAFFGSGAGKIHMDDVACSGGETSIFSCTFTSRHNCGHGEDVGVICT